MRRHSIVGNYYRLDPRKRINVILYHFEGFPSIIRNYEMELEDWILDARARARRESLGDLGVRIQNGRNDFSPTENEYQEKSQVEEIVQRGCLDESSRRLSEHDELQRGLLEIRLMKREYERVRTLIGSLGKSDRTLFINYICRENRAADLSGKLMMQQASVRKKMYRMKKKLFEGYEDSFGIYSDDTILLLCI